MKHQEKLMYILVTIFSYIKSKMLHRIYSFMVQAETFRNKNDGETNWRDKGKGFWWNQLMANEVTSGVKTLCLNDQRETKGKKNNSTDDCRKI